MIETSGAPWRLIIVVGVAHVSDDEKLEGSVVEAPPDCFAGAAIGWFSLPADGVFVDVNHNRLSAWWIWRHGCACAFMPYRVGQ